MCVYLTLLPNEERLSVRHPQFGSLRALWVGLSQIPLWSWPLSTAGLRGHLLNEWRVEQTVSAAA